MMKEKIQTRLSNAKLELERGKAQLNALLGAIAEMEYWISQLEDSAPPCCDDNEGAQTNES